MNNIFMHALFFLLYLFHFHRTLFRGLVGASVNPKRFFCAFTCSTSSMYALPVILFLAERKHLNVFVKGYYTAG